MAPHWCKKVVLQWMMMLRVNCFVVGLNRLNLTIVVTGVGVLFGGHVVGVVFVPWC